MVVVVGEPSPFVIIIIPPIIYLYVVGDPLCLVIHLSFPHLIIYLLIPHIHCYLFTFPPHCCCCDPAPFHCCYYPTFTLCPDLYYIPHVLNLCLPLGDRWWASCWVIHIWSVLFVCFWNTFSVLVVVVEHMGGDLFCWFVIPFYCIIICCCCYLPPRYVAYIYCIHCCCWWSEQWTCITLPTFIVLHITYTLHCYLLPFTFTFVCSIYSFIWSEHSGGCVAFWYKNHLFPDRCWILVCPRSFVFCSPILYDIHLHLLLHSCSFTFLVRIPRHSPRYITFVIRTHVTFVWNIHFTHLHSLSTHCSPHLFPYVVCCTFVHFCTFIWILHNLLFDICDCLFDPHYIVSWSMVIIPIYLPHSLPWPAPLRTFLPIFCPLTLWWWSDASLPWISLWWWSGAFTLPLTHLPHGVEWSGQTGEWDGPIICYVPPFFLLALLFVVVGGWVLLYIVGGIVTFIYLSTYTQIIHVFDVSCVLVIYIFICYICYLFRLHSHYYTSFIPFEDIPSSLPFWYLHLTIIHLHLITFPISLILFPWYHGVVVCYIYDQRYVIHFTFTFIYRCYIAVGGWNMVGDHTFLYLLLLILPDPIPPYYGITVVLLLTITLFDPHSPSVELLLCICSPICVFPDHLPLYSPLLLCCIVVD